ncbi:MAG: hypothetical protein ACOYZ7_20945 [Chloroflexota bacterium]
MTDEFLDRNYPGAQVLPVELGSFREGDREVKYTVTGRGELVVSLPSNAVALNPVRGQSDVYVFQHNEKDGGHYYISMRGVSTQESQMVLYFGLGTRVLSGLELREGSHLVLSRGARLATDLVVDKLIAKAGYPGYTIAFSPQHGYERWSSAKLLEIDGVAVFQRRG